MSERTKGIILALAGGTLWGFSGACGQFLFQYKGAHPYWVSVWRMLLSGLILLAISFIQHKKAVFRAFSKALILPMLIFSLIAVVMCQYGYFCAIGASNSATATVLQYISPVFVMLFVCIASKRLPSKTELAALACAVASVFLMATGGSIHNLSISKTALVWGILSGIGYSMYTVQSPSLSAQCGLFPMLAWGNLIGSVIMICLNPQSLFSYTPDMGGFMALMGTTVVGNVISYSLFVVGCKKAGSVTGSLCACIEPLSSAVFAFLWLGTRFKASDFAGLVLIVGTVVILTLSRDSGRAEQS